MTIMPTPGFAHARKKPAKGGWFSRLDERLRHGIMAAVISLVLVVGMVLDPVDQFYWLLQSRVTAKEPSGQFVFMSADENLADPAKPERRIKLARALERFDRQGAERIVLNIVFDEPSTPEADQRLGDAIEAWGDDIWIAVAHEDAGGGETKVRTSIPEIARDAQVAVEKYDFMYTGYAWEDDAFVEHDRVETPSVATALSGNFDQSYGTTHIDYAYEKHTQFKNLKGLLEDPGTQNQANYLTGKKALISSNHNTQTYEYSVPAIASVAKSNYFIYAAETRLTSHLQKINIFTAYLLGILIVAFIIYATQTPTSKRKYTTVVTLMVVVGLGLGISIQLRIAISGLVAVFVSYGALRSYSRVLRRDQSQDPVTGLAKLAVLEDQLITNQPGHVIVAKIHGFETVLTTLPKEQRPQYIVKIAERLRATDGGVELYNENHQFAWYTPEASVAPIIDHLEGLRALFQAPLALNDRTVDVGITFGVCPVAEHRASALSLAVAAAEEADEASQPIIVAQDGTQNDLVWSVSMRARIDAAMEKGEVFCLYQPKLNARTNRVFGVEALVRWNDPERGSIPPDLFIQQCEKAGRMEGLTRFVLQSACTAGRLLHARNHRWSMSVNISATMMNSIAVVSMVREVVEATRFDPRYLVLEITETARIADLDTASLVLKQLKQIGVHLSMDDFGVGAANLETLLRLPFDELKIDRMFVGHMAKDVKARAIAASLIALGKQSDISVVAEGVETEADLQSLIKMGCDQVQGYVFSHPVSLSQLLELEAPADVSTGVVRDRMV